ncbi:MAG: histidine phosphatase family protein [Polyangiaceae bacterium]
MRSSVPETDGLHLSLAGRQLVRAVGNKLRLDDAPSIDRVVVSPEPAAIQTAELFADRLDYVGAIEIASSLLPGVPAEIAATQLMTQGESIIVVADEPTLSALGAFLVGRPTFPQLDRAQISAIEDRKPTFYLRANTLARLPLNVA